MERSQSKRSKHSKINYCHGDLLLSSEGSSISIGKNPGKENKENVAIDMGTFPQQHHPHPHI